MGRQENIEIFKDTEKLCKENTAIKEALQKSRKGQKLIPEDVEMPLIDKKRFGHPAKVVVSKKRTLEAAAAYKETKTAVHNFASASNPGGGVERGANAQEECLCRCSDLYFCLNTPEMLNGFYRPHRQARNPIHNDDIIFTPEVLVFKRDSECPKLLDGSEWYQVDVITCAAPNLRERLGNTFNTGDGRKSVKMSDEALLDLHERRLRRILDTAISEKDETVILGAFGCGAFKNKPEIVVQAAGNVIEDYLYAFKNIEFAVYCSPRDDRNFRVFENYMGKYVGEIRSKDGRY